MQPVEYNAAVAEWFRRAAPPPPGGALGRAGSPVAGCEVEAGATTDGTRLLQVGFRACACPHIIAACHLLAARLPGRPVAALVAAGLRAELDELEIPVEKAGKILILQDALKACHAAIQGGQGRGIAD